ncbi:low affinity immunoglobulin gamma Fc region receptor II-a-like [Alligator sinensis]|uniref:low affinity immunoglobulin gamma Fc region receptor II-a-like n=1 Tax=Alligator sinensis TaxID=38654 RepID=UPI000D723575|nr:low affinity immunoglobulin gamma Fc region receptor II-a-like [Alligator sinensis]
MHKARRDPVGSQSDLLEGTGLHVSLGSLRVAVGTAGQKEQTSPASMLCLVIFAAHALGLAAEQKAVLTLDSPWSTVFKGESVTLSCSGPCSAGSTHTSWYLEGRSLKSTETNMLPIKAAELTDKGRYQCKTSNSTRSDTVQLTVSADWLILQAPYYAVFEGGGAETRPCTNCSGPTPTCLTLLAKGDASVWVTVDVTFSLLCLTGASVATVVCIRHRQKTVCPREQESEHTVCSIVSIEEGGGAKPTGTPQMDDQEHLVTYAVLRIPKPSWDSASRARASEGGDPSWRDIYETIPDL